MVVVVLVVVDRRKVGELYTPIAYIYLKWSIPSTFLN